MIEVCTELKYYLAGFLNSIGAAGIFSRWSSLGCGLNMFCVSSSCFDVYYQPEEKNCETEFVTVSGFG